MHSVHLWAIAGYFIVAESLAIIYDLMQLTPAQNITKLIATIDYPTPAYYEAFEHVDRFQALDLNKILTLNPDVVITWKNQIPPSIIALLR